MSCGCPELSQLPAGLVTCSFLTTIRIRLTRSTGSEIFTIRSGPSGSRYSAARDVWVARCNVGNLGIVAVWVLRFALQLTHGCCDSMLGWAIRYQISEMIQLEMNDENDRLRLKSKKQQRNGFDMSKKEGFKNSKLSAKNHLFVGCSKQRGQQPNFHRIDGWGSYIVFYLFLEDPAIWTILKINQKVL